MWTPLLSLVVLAGLSADDAATKSEVRSFIDTVDALQRPIRDFQCEFEGVQILYDKELLEYHKVTQGDPFDILTGVYIWKSDGTALSDAYHSYPATGQTTRETIIDRPKAKESEHYLRRFDSPVGRVKIDRPDDTNTNREGSLGGIFLVDEVRRMALGQGFRPSLGEDVLDGRPVTVLALAPGENQPIAAKYWIDLRRGGHTIRREHYRNGNKLSQRLDVSLEKFDVGGQEAWLPTSGVTNTYVARSMRSKELAVRYGTSPAHSEKMNMIRGTLRFNEGPRTEVFQAAYRPGTPVSDVLRQAQSTFGQQKLPRRRTTQEAEKMLLDQVEMAHQQGKELSAGPTVGSWGWTTIQVGFGTAALVISLTLFLRSRRR